MAGSAEKCRWLINDLGFDEVINYRECDDFGQAIREACPEGVDVYFDNVGGDILDGALLNMNFHGRIAFCGWISTYNDAGMPGPKNLWQLLAKSVTMQGFVVTDYIQDFSSAKAEMAAWLSEGKIQFKEDIVEGLDNVLPTFHTLFDGTNKGKLILHISD